MFEYPLRRPVNDSVLVFFFANPPFSYSWFHQIACFIMHQQKYKQRVYSMIQSNKLSVVLQCYCFDSFLDLISSKLLQKMFSHNCFKLVNNASKFARIPMPSLKVFQATVIEKSTQKFSNLFLTRHLSMCENENIEKKLNNGLKNVLRTIEKDSESDIAGKKLFAVVHIAGKQFKVSNNDIIMTNNKIDAECGDVIRLEKVLAVGSRTFTLLGQPLLKRELVNVEAMVMEKTKGEKKVAFKKKRRKSYKKWKGHRQDLSVLKINSINFDTSVI